MGEAMKQMADVKYSLDDNIKQNFLEPLHHLQTKDLKEVMVGWLLKKSWLFYLTRWVALSQFNATRIRDETERKKEGKSACIRERELISLFVFSITGKSFRDEGWTSIASGDVKRKVYLDASWLYLSLRYLLIYLSTTHWGRAHCVLAHLVQKLDACRLQLYAHRVAHKSVRTLLKTSYGYIIPVTYFEISLVL